MENGGDAGPRPRRAAGRLCSICSQRKAALKRPKNLQQICRECFYNAFEDEIHQVIVENNLFRPGERVAVAASGGKGLYSPNAYRGFAREFIIDLERIRPRAILDIIMSGEDFRIATSTKMPEQGTCERCGYISSQKLCKACVLLEGLNRGLPKLGIGRTKGVNGPKEASVER